LIGKNRHYAQLEKVKLQHGTQNFQVSFFNTNQNEW